MAMACDVGLFTTPKRPSGSMVLNIRLYVKLEIVFDAPNKLNYLKQKARMFRKYRL